MGGGSSTAQRHQQLGKSQKAIVDLMMPLYFDPVDCTHEEHKAAEAAWNLVLTDKSPEFLARKGTEGFPYLSNVTFFFDSFYCRLFDIHPAAKELFKHGMKGQGKFLVMMISLSLSEIEKPVQFDKSLIKLAEIHYKKAVKAVEYGIVGEVLFYALHKVLGDAYYTPSLHRVWVKIYSRMLKTIIPVAVSCELKGKAAAAAGKSEDEGPSRTTVMFHAHPPPGSDNDGEPPLKCQEILDNNNSERREQVRPASKV